MARDHLYRAVCGVGFLANISIFAAKTALAIPSRSKRRASTRINPRFPNNSDCAAPLGVDDCKETPQLREPKGQQPLLANRVVRIAKSLRQWVGEHRCGFFKGHAMLAQVCHCLRLVPLKSLSHRHSIADLQRLTSAAAVGCPMEGNVCLSSLAANEPRDQ